MSFLNDLPNDIAATRPNPDLLSLVNGPSAGLGGDDSFDLLQEASKVLQGRGFLLHEKLGADGSEQLQFALERHGAYKVIQNAVRAAGIFEQDAALDIAHETWVKIHGNLGEESLQSLGERFSDAGQYEGTLWIAARRKVIDFYRAQQRERRRKVTYDGEGPQDDGVVIDAQLPEFQHAKASSAGDDLVIRLDRQRLVELIREKLLRDCTAKRQPFVARDIALLEMDVAGVEQDGCLPATAYVCRVLEFPSASTVSQARRRYREVAEEVGSEHGWN